MNSANYSKIRGALQGQDSDVAAVLVARYLALYSSQAPSLLGPREHALRYTMCYAPYLSVIRITGSAAEIYRPQDPASTYVTLPKLLQPYARRVPQHAPPRAKSQAPRRQATTKQELQLSDTSQRHRKARISRAHPATRLPLISHARDHNHPTGPGGQLRWHPLLECTGPSHTLSNSFLHGPSLTRRHQESYFTYGDEAPSIVNHDINFRSGIGADGSETYTPRALIYDLKGACFFPEGLA